MRDGVSPRTDWGLARRVMFYAREDRRWLWVVLALTPLAVLADTLQPILLKTGIDDHIMTKQPDGLPVIAAIFGLTVAFGWLFSALGSSALQRVSLRALARLRAAIFQHVIRQGSRFFDRRHAGSLLSRTINDVDAVYESLARGAIQLLTNSLTILAMLIAMLAMSPTLTLVTFLFSPIIWLIVGWFRRRLRPISAQIRETLAHLNGYFAERIFGMTIVQLYGAEPISQRTFDTMSKGFMQAYHRSNWLDAGLYAIMDGMSALATAAVVYVVAVQFTDTGSAVTTGLLVAFNDYIGRIFVPIRELSGQIATLQRSFAALEKIFDLLDTDESIPEGTHAPETVAGRVELRDVFFRYAPDRPLVLHGIDLDVKPGEVVALVGATGSGKTTIGKLLTRQYDGYEGHVRLDGVEITDYRLTAVRDAVTVVHQDVWLLEGTLADNVRLGDDRISDEAIARAGRLAQASDFVDRLPAGWQTPVSERGTNLSSGQRQLLSIARALARPAPIVILDEATSSVDALTEKQIDRALEALFAERTVIVIAHRLQTIQKADRIVVLHQGRIIEEGTHAALMALGGRYRLLVETGFAL